MSIQTLVVGSMATNCYIVDGIIIDPGDDTEYIVSHITTPPKMIMATHGHFDHILAAYALQLAYNIPFYMHEADAFLLKTMQSSAKHFLHIDVDPPPKLSEIHDLPFIHTPGHTPGSICLYFKKEGVIFTGDTLLGRTDFAYSDKIAHARSVSTIFSLPPETKVYPGHGEVGDTIGLWRTK